MAEYAWLKRSIDVMNQQKEGLIPGLFAKEVAAGEASSDVELKLPFSVHIKLGIASWLTTLGRELRVMCSRRDL